MSDNYRLELCQGHADAVDLHTLLTVSITKQETNQSHFDKHNCDFCKLEAEVERLRGEVERLDVARLLGTALEVQRLRAMLVNLAIPVEALLLDEGSHKYIAPTVLAEIQAALQHTRKQLTEVKDERR